MKFPAAVAATCLLSFANAGYAETYECQLKIYTIYGGVPDRVLVSIDRKAGTATALDKYIYHIHKKPIPAQVKQMNPNKYELKWELDGLPFEGNKRHNTASIFRIDLAKLRATYIGHVKGFIGTREGRGKCKMIKK